MPAAAGATAPAATVEGRRSANSERARAVEPGLSQARSSHPCWFIDAEHLLQHVDRPFRVLQGINFDYVIDANSIHVIVAMATLLKTIPIAAQGASANSDMPILGELIERISGDDRVDSVHGD